MDTEQRSGTQDAREVEIKTGLPAPQISAPVQIQERVAQDLPLLYQALIEVLAADGKVIVVPSETNRTASWALSGAVTVVSCPL